MAVILFQLSVWRYTIFLVSENGRKYTSTKIIPVHVMCFQKIMGKATLPISINTILYLHIDGMGNRVG